MQLLRFLSRRAPPLYDIMVMLTARRVVVRERSMYPSLRPGEYALIDRLTYRIRPPARGDIVLARHPPEPLLLLKRVAGVPGDRVRLAEGRAAIGETDREAAEGQGHVQQRADAGRTWVLREDEYLLLGDALELSVDSRAFGPVTSRAILGRAWLVYWPRWRRVV